MKRSIELPVEIVAGIGAEFVLGVDYYHDPGEPRGHGPGAPEEIEIQGMGFISKGGDGELALNGDQFGAIMETCEDAIAAACLEDAHACRRADGWKQVGQAWMKPAKMKRAPEYRDAEYYRNVLKTLAAEIRQGKYT